LLANQRQPDNARNAGQNPPLGTGNPTLKNDNPKNIAENAARDGIEYVPNELLVMVSRPVSITSEGGKLTTGAPELTQALTRLGLTTASEVVPGTYKLSGSNVDVMSAARALQAQKAVSYAGPNHVY